MTRLCSKCDSQQQLYNLQHVDAAEQERLLQNAAAYSVPAAQRLLAEQADLKPRASLLATTSTFGLNRKQAQEHEDALATATTAVAKAGTSCRSCVSLVTAIEKAVASSCVRVDSLDRARTVLRTTQTQHRSAILVRAGAAETFAELDQIFDEAQSNDFVDKATRDKIDHLRQERLKDGASECAICDSK